MTKHITNSTIAIATLLLCAAPTGRAAEPAREGKEIVSKQAPAPTTEEPWVFSISPYLWMPLAIDVSSSLPQVNILDRTIVGDLSRNSTFRDTANKLTNVKAFAITAQGRVEFSKGHWGGFLDGYWLSARLSDSSSRSKLVLRNVEVGTATSITERFETGQINFGPRYLFTPIHLGQGANGPTVAFEAYAGARINATRNSLDGTLVLSGAALGRTADTTTSFSTSSRRVYAEPLLGIKSVWSFSEKFAVLVRCDVGGFGAVENDHWDCDLEAALLWTFHKNTSFDIGYRARGQWESHGASSNVSTTGWFHGPELGVTFKF